MRANQQISRPEKKRLQFEGFTLQIERKKTQIFISLEDQKSEETFVENLREGERKLGENIRKQTLELIYDTFSKVCDHAERMEQTPKIYDELKDNGRSLKIG